MRLHARNEEILRIALPAIVTNITVPLLGLVDTAIVGHMGDATYIGAIAVGSMIFNLIYWIFGFLRMGTSGMTAQAYGRDDREETADLLRRSLTLALLIAGGLLLLQWPLRELMLWLIGPTPDVRPLAVSYFHIVVWGAPAMLSLYALTGWFIGMQDTRTPMVVSIVQNVTNIIASLLLVYGFGLKVEGVALGTVVAQYVGVVWAVFSVFFSGNLAPRTSHLVPRKIHLVPRLKAIFNSTYLHIFLRTLCLVAVNLYFTSAGARQGATILAVNTLLMQLYLLFSYIMDGFAYAGEALGGRYWGARDWAAYHDVVRRLFGWGAVMTLLFTAVYVVGGLPFLHLLTDEPAVVDAARDYVWWAYLVPVAGVAAFVWDGIFIGSTLTRGMLLSSLVAAAMFFVGTSLLTKNMENHGLWLSMLLYLAARGIVQTVYFKNDSSSRSQA